VDEVVLAGDRMLAEHGLLDAKEYDFGHGVGADTPEHPRLILDTNRMVELGSVIAVHVAIRRPGADTAFVGGPVLVEDSGVRELVPAAPWASS
jgi:Xaa-Pro aminopeptidase